MWHVAHSSVPFMLSSPAMARLALGREIGDGPSGGGASGGGGGMSPLYCGSVLWSYMPSSGCEPPLFTNGMGTVAYLQPQIGHDIGLQAPIGTR